MNNIRSNALKLQPFLNQGERIQKSLFGTFQQEKNANSIPQKGILCATNERIFFYSDEVVQSFSVLDYYKIDAVDLLPLAMSLHHEGMSTTLSFIEEGDIGDFNHFVLDRMIIKS